MEIRMGKKQEKTNVLRIFDSKKINYEYFEYDETITEGIEVAKILNEPFESVYKTLVTVSPKNINYVFVIPVNKTLDLKKAAKTVSEKSVAMIKQKELLPLTGYIHGGCSPIGMKKLFTTVIDISAQNLPYIYVSAGRVGRQVKVNPVDIVKLTNARFSDIIKETESL